MTDADELAADKFLADLRTVMPQLFDAKGDILPLQAVREEEREQLNDEAQAAKHQERARAFAQSLIDAAPPIERIRMAAPAPASARKQRPRSNAFDPRHPTWIEERHGPFRECIDRRFAETAHRLGRTASYANSVRDEIALISLTRGEVPPFTVIDGRRLHPQADEGMLAAAIFPSIWQAHERALVEAERQGITRNSEPSPLRSKKAALLAELFEATTTMKIIGHALATRLAFKVLGRVIEMCRAEIRS